MTRITRSFHLQNDTRWRLHIRTALLLIGSLFLFFIAVLLYRYMTPPMFANTFYVSSERSILPGYWSQRICRNAHQVLAVDVRLNMVLIVTSASPPTSTATTELRGGYADPASNSDGSVVWRFEGGEVRFTPQQNVLIVINPRGESARYPLPAGILTDAFKHAENGVPDYKELFNKVTLANPKTMPEQQ